MSSGKWRPFCFGRNVLKIDSNTDLWLTYPIAQQHRANRTDGQMNFDKSCFKFCIFKNGKFCKLGK